PCGSRITFEPGGQLELSGPPGTTVADGVNGMAADLAVIDRGLDAAGLRRLGAGVDPWRPPVRVVDTPRYQAMEAFFNGHDDGRFEGLTATLPFGTWVDRGHAVGFPTADDLDYHLTTLFPPVRLRGWIEVRYLDALPDPWWRAAAAIVGTLLVDEEAGERAAAAVSAHGADQLWVGAARAGLTAERWVSAELACLEPALDSEPY